MKPCEVCGIELVRRDREWLPHFERRRYCSKRCAGVAGNPRKPAGEFRSRYRKVNTPDGRNMMEHRWVMEQHLGRELLPTEQVHHINHNRLDNRVENLEVVTTAEHGKRHTIHPTTKPCVVCGQVFTPHKTKRARAQTCGPECKSRLLSIRNAERKAS